MLESLFNKVAGLQAFKSAALLKIDSNISTLLWILRKYYEQLFLLNTSDGCFCNLQLINN